jgi:carboxyl-terminal processing protease
MKSSQASSGIQRYLMFIVFLSVGWFANAQVPSHPEQKFLRAMDIINRFYVDSVNSDKMVEKALVKILEDLDPHSNYLTPEEVKEMNEPLQGNFEGIGVAFNILNDTILIINPVPGGPSERLGIKAGDKIIKINNDKVAGVGITNKGVFERLRGAKGTKVNVSIKRNGELALLDFTITRDKIPIYSLDAAYMVDDKIGYIKLNRFALTTSKEFFFALDSLRKHGLKSLILDLSGNGGGYLDEAITLANQFLTKDKLIVYTEGLNSPRIEYDADSKGEFEKGNVVVLIDESSASASEILSGALQDWDRAVIVGRRSFGKGLVQRPFPLPDGSMLRLTVARYYTPTGRLIQKSYQKGLKEYENDIMNRYKHGEFITADSIHMPDSLVYYTKEKHRKVYGGGGIMPDVFVPLDTANYSDYYRDLVRKGILNQFILNYIDKNRSSLLSAYPNFDLFKDKFTVSDELFAEMLAFAEKEKLAVNQKDLAISGSTIRKLVKAYLARDLWNTSEFYEVYNQDEPTVQKAIMILNNWKKYGF